MNILEIGDGEKREYLRGIEKIRILKQLVTN